MKPAPTLYQPKGSMCMACQHLQRDCSGLDFHNMPMIRCTELVVVVRCTEYVRIT